jgi:eukaryotic-like serine/threonine-protein kinase
MRWLSDTVVSRLQSEMLLPDLSGTRYRAVKFVARGGMGTVWLAQDTVLERNVALKILAPENSSADLAVRLLHEAVVLAQLEHPGIVPVHDAGTLIDGRTFYCMKYVEGQTLDQYAAGRSLRDRLQLLQRVAEPLAFAHSRGIIHRDLKPGNIMIGAFGEVLVMDWGLAKITGNKPGEASAGPIESLSGAKSTGHGSVLGTPGYMAPEQARGELQSIDERTDVFALGALLNFMIGDVASQRSSVPKVLVAICRKAMAAETAARYASVSEMASDIGKYLEGLPVSAYRESLVERAVRLARRHQVAIVLVLVYLLMRLVFILFSRR